MKLNDLFSVLASSTQFVITRYLSGVGSTMYCSSDYNIVPPLFFWGDVEVVNIHIHADTLFVRLERGVSSDKIDLDLYSEALSNS